MERADPHIEAESLYWSWQEHEAQCRLCRNGCQCRIGRHFEQTWKRHLRMALEADDAKQG